MKEGFLKLAHTSALAGAASGGHTEMPRSLGGGVLVPQLLNGQLKCGPSSLLILGEGEARPWDISSTGTVEAR